MNKDSTLSNRTTQALLILVFATFAVVLLRSAYVNEDAYITMRTVDNFVHGYGLRWNVAERVQTFTHPLWLIMITVLYFVTHEAFYTLIFLSFGVSLATFYVAAIHFKKQTIGTVVVLTILIFSKAFIDFSSSGLENPATHLLLALFLLLFLQGRDENFLEGKTVFLLSLIAGLATLNRMDTVLFFLPALAWVFIQNKKTSTIKNILLGFLPFILWEVFAVVYYGFPFPNTAYAKLYTGLGRAELLEEGFIYLLNSLNWDPITLLTVFAGTGLAFYKGSWKEKSIAAGVWLYILYLTWIGGDYMSGRFFSGALLVSVILLARQFADFEPTEAIIALVLIVAAGFASPTPTLTSVNDETFSTARTDVNGIYDLRSYYFQTSGLIYARNNYPKPFHEWVFRGIMFRESQKHYLVEGTIGYTGYFAGPQLFIIDPNALGDPLLARLKPIPQEHWIPGHFEREVPNGYLETIRSGRNEFEDKSLGEYYMKLWFIISGPIFSPERLEAIWKMNTGQYDYLLQTYESRPVVTSTATP
jgi:arabinofuranosyltransferase